MKSGAKGMLKTTNIFIKMKQKRKTIVIILLSLSVFLTILQLISKLLLLSILSFIAWILLIVGIIHYILKLIEVLERKPISLPLNKFQKDKAYKSLLKKGIIEDHHLLPFIRTKCFDDLLTNIKRKNNVILISESGVGKTKLIVELLKELPNDRIFSKEYKKVFFWRGEAETDVSIAKGLYVCENIGNNVDTFCKLAAELESVGAIFIATTYPEELYDRHRWIQNKANYVPIDVYLNRDEWKRIVKTFLRDFEEKGLDVACVMPVIEEFSGNLIPPLQLNYSLSRALKRGIEIDTEDKLYSVIEIEYGERKDIEEKIKGDSSEFFLYSIRLVTWLTNKNYIEENIIKTVFKDFLKREKHQYGVALETLSGDDVFYILKKIGKKIYIPDYHLNRLEKYWCLKDYTDELQKLTEFLDVKIRDDRKIDFWIGLGDRFFELKNCDKALIAYTEAYNKTLDILQKGILHIKIGEIYAIKSSFEESLQNYNKAIELFESIEKPSVTIFCYLGDAYERKGDIYFKKEDTDNAINSYERALSIYNTASKINFARLSIKVAKILEESFLKSQRKRKNRIEKSITYAKNAKESYFKLNNYDGIAASSMILGTCLSLLDILSNKNIGEEAISYFQNALESVDKLVDKIRKIDIYLEIGERCHLLYTAVIPTKFIMLLKDHPLLQLSLEAYKDSLYTTNYVLENKDYFIKILKIREEEYKEKMCIISQRLGETCVKKGDYENALNYYNDVLRVLEVLDAHEEICEVYIKIGETYHFDDKYEKAIEALKIAEKIASSMFNDAALANIYNVILHIYLEWETYSEAEPYVKKLEKVIDSIEDLSMKASGYLRMGDLSRSLKKYGDAKKYYECAKNCLENYPNKETGHYHHLLAWAYASLGQIALTINSFKEAKKYLIKSYELFLDLPAEEYNAGISLSALGSLYRVTKDIKKSNEYFKKARKVFKNINKKSKEAGCLMELSTNYVILEDYQRAEEILQEALTLSDDPSIQLRINVHLSVVYSKLKEYGNSRKHLDDALRIWKEHYPDNVFIRLNILERLGNVYLEQGLFEESRQFYKNCISLYKEKVGEKELQHLLELARLHEKVGKTYHVGQKAEEGNNWYKIAREYLFKAEELVGGETNETKLYLLREIKDISQILNDKNIVNNYLKKMRELLPPQIVLPIRILEPQVPRVVFRDRNCILCGSRDNIKECPESHIIYCRKCCKEEIKCDLYQRCWES